MSDLDLTKMQKKVEKYLDRERFVHTVGVRYTCAALAMRYRYDLEKAQIAGLLHDCAKCIPAEKKRKLCLQHNIEISETEARNLFLLHAKLGSWIAEQKYQVYDPEILGAIRYHTTGREAMSLLEKITYLADYIEPKRNKAKNLAEIRELAFQDIDQAVCQVLKDTLNYLEQAGRDIDPLTKKAYHYYKNLCTSL